MGDRPEALVYFVCFIAIIAYWLLPVIVAVMLDKFSTAAARQEHRHIRRIMVSRDRDGLTESRPLDPLLNVLMSCGSVHAVRKRIVSIYLDIYIH